MKAYMVVGLVLMVAGAAQAFDKSKNPDRVPSIGFAVSKGKLPGMLTDVGAGAPRTDGGFVKGALDYQYPLSNALTVKAFGSTTGVNNNLQFSEGHEIGIGLRIYLQD